MELGAGQGPGGLTAIPLPPPHPAPPPKAQVLWACLRIPKPAHIFDIYSQRQPPERIPALLDHQVKVLDSSHQVTSNEQVHQSDDHMDGLGKTGAGDREPLSGNRP